MTVDREVERREPSHTVGQNMNGVAAVENSLQVPQKTKRGGTMPSGSPAVGFTSKEMRSVREGRVHSHSLSIGKRRKRTHTAGVRET